MFRKNHLPVIGFLLIVIAAIVSSPTYSDVSIHRRSIPTEYKDVRVHALLIIPANDPAISQILKVDSSKIQTLLMEASQNCGVRVTIMRSKTDATATVTEKRMFLKQLLDEQSSEQTESIRADHVTAWIRNLEPKANDTILVYYTGHGNITESGAHILQFGTDEKNIMDRQELSDLLSQKPCRLKLLITDMDSSGPRVTEPLNPDDPNAVNTVGSTHTARRLREVYAFQDLFLEHEGFLNLTAATEGEHSWGTEINGGIFTNALHDSIFEGLDLNSNHFLSWEEVFKLTREQVMLWHRRTSAAGFIELNQEKGIESQRPKYYGELPKRIENKTAK